MAFKIQNNEIVIIIEDDPLLINVTSKMIELMGYNTEKFMSRDDAWEWISTHYRSIYDNLGSIIIFMDVFMQGMRTDEFIRNVETLTEKIPLIISSGNNWSSIYKIKGISKYKMNFIQKPYNPHDIMKVFNTISPNANIQSSKIIKKHK